MVNQIKVVNEIVNFLAAYNAIPKENNYHGFDNVMLESEFIHGYTEIYLYHSFDKNYGYGVKEDILRIPYFIPSSEIWNAFECAEQIIRNNKNIIIINHEDGYEIYVDINKIDKCILKHPFFDVESNTPMGAINRLEYELDYERHNWDAQKCNMFFYKDNILLGSKDMDEYINDTKEKKFKKVITHNGIFHADDIFSVALVNLCVGKIEIERKREISKEEYDNPQVMIIDVGGRFNEHLSNLDHHQDVTLEAACMLTLEFLKKKRYVSEELYNELLESFMAISYVDRNGYAENSGFQVNSLIKSFNGLENGFNIAVEVAENYIRAAMDTVAKSKESREIWDSAVIIDKSIRVCRAFPIKWKSYEEEPFLIYPQDGKYNLISIDSSKYPITTNNTHDFLHNGKFIAVFKNREDAIESAKLSIIE